MQGLFFVPPQLNPSNVVCEMWSSHAIIVMFLCGLCGKGVQVVYHSVLKVL